MCIGGAPKPPRVKPDKNLERQMQMQMDMLRQQRSADKAARFEQTLDTLTGMGRRSLLSGGRGGAGFAAPQARSLFTGLR